MAAQQQSGGLFRKYGQRLDAAVKQHAMADPKMQGFPSIPAPIKDGTAELESIGFYQYKEDSNMKKVDGSSAVGEYFFRAVGICREPEVIVDKDGRQIRCEGVQTSQMVPVLDTKNQKGEVTSMEQNIEKIEGHLKLLGASKEELAQGAAAMEAIVEAMQQQVQGGEAIYFKFETSEGKATPEYPNPRVWENWYGIRERQGYEPPSKGPTPGVSSDKTRQAAPSTNGPAKSPAAQQVAKQQAAKAPAKPAPAPEPEPELPDDVRELAALCESGDDKAIQKLQDIALGLGVTEDEWGATANYGEAADLVEAAQANSTASPDEPAPVVPSKGEVYEWFPVDAKTGKPLKKAVEVEVTTVDKKTETATIKRSDTKAVVKGVKFADLVIPVTV